MKYVIEIHKPPKFLWKHSLFFVTNVNKIRWILLFDGFCPKAVAIQRENSHISLQYIGTATSSGNKIMSILTEAAGKFVNTLILLPTYSSTEELAKLTTCSAPRKQMLLSSENSFPYAYSFIYLFLLPLERRLESSALCICEFGLSHLLALWGWVVTQVASKTSQSSLVPASLHLGLWEQSSYQIKVPSPLWHSDSLLEHRSTTHMWYSTSRSCNANRQWRVFAQRDGFRRKKGSSASSATVFQTARMRCPLWDVMPGWKMDFKKCNARLIKAVAHKYTSLKNKVWTTAFIMVL